MCDLRIFPGTRMKAAHRRTGALPRLTHNIIPRMERCQNFLNYFWWKPP